MSDAPASTTAPTHRRSARNYLIDRNFQLKYAGFLAGTALVVSVALGTLIFRTSTEVIQEGQKTVERVARPSSAASRSSSRAAR
jgi:hypothetical protein